MSPDLPAELHTALAQDRQAKAIFETLSPSHQREYIRWISEAKRETTRASRAEKTIERLLTNN